eukprot:2270070-Amphidinium_carterae.2
MLRYDDWDWHCAKVNGTFTSVRCHSVEGRRLMTERKRKSRVLSSFALCDIAPTQGASIELNMHS